MLSTRAFGRHFNTPLFAGRVFGRHLAGLSGIGSGLPPVAQELSCLHFMLEISPMLDLGPIGSIESIPFKLDLETEQLLSLTLITRNVTGLQVAVEVEPALEMEVDFSCREG